MPVVGGEIKKSSGGVPEPDEYFTFCSVCVRGGVANIGTLHERHRFFLRLPQEIQRNT